VSLTDHFACLLLIKTGPHFYLFSCVFTFKSSVQSSQQLFTILLE